MQHDIYVWVPQQHSKPVVFNSCVGPQITLIVRKGFWNLTGLSLFNWRTWMTDGLGTSRTGSPWIYSVPVTTNGTYYCYKSFFGIATLMSKTHSFKNKNKTQFLKKQISCHHQKYSLEPNRIYNKCNKHVQSAATDQTMFLSSKYHLAVFHECWNS